MLYLILTFSLYESDINTEDGVKITTAPPLEFCSFEIRRRVWVSESRSLRRDGGGHLQQVGVGVGVVGGLLCAVALPSLPPPPPAPPPPHLKKKAAEKRRRAGSGRRRKARCQGTAGRGLLGAVNIFQKRCFVPQTSCLQQHGLIQALCANTSVALDQPPPSSTSPPQPTSPQAHTHTYHKHTFPTY